MTQTISLFTQVRGFFVGTKANIEALTGIQEGSFAYATDTDELGTYNGTTWAWSSGTGGLVAAQILAAGSENIADADFLGFVDTSDGNTLKKIAPADFRSQYLSNFYLRLDQLSNWPHQGSDPSAPAAGFTKVYVRSTGLFLRDNTGIIGPLIAQALADTLYAPIAKGVTNGDTHNHQGGDGATLDENALQVGDVTTLNASTSAHGFLKKLSNIATEFMNGVGNWVRMVSAVQMLFTHGLNATIPAGATNYLNLHAFGLQTSATNIEVTRDCTAQRLRFNTNGVQPGSGTLVVTLQKNNVDTAITLTVPINGAAGSYTDLVNTVSLVAGDLIQLKGVNNAGSASAPIIRSSMELEF